MGRLPANENHGRNAPESWHINCGARVSARFDATPYRVTAGANQERIDAEAVRFDSVGSVQGRLLSPFQQPQDQECFAHDPIASRYSVQSLPIGTAAE